MIRAVDVGFGSVKAIGNNKSVEYPSAVGDYRPVRFVVKKESQELKDKLCVEYEGKRYFIGDIAYAQSIARVTMSSARFTSKEGMVNMLSALVLLSSHHNEKVKIVTGLPVNDYVDLKDRYQDAIVGKHNIQIISPDGVGGDHYTFDIQDVKVLPQPLGTIFNAILSSEGEINDKVLGNSKIGVLDVGKCTVDLIVMDAFQFVNKYSTSFSDIGLFDAYKELSLALRSEGYDIPPDSLEPYIRNNKPLNGLAEMKEEIFESQAEKIMSRLKNTWMNMWSFDQVFITGGGAIVLGGYLKKYFDKELVLICENPTMSNCCGYHKAGLKAWGLD